MSSEKKGSVWSEGESFLTGSSEKEARIDAYIEWLLTRRADRDPTTKDELAAQLGVTAATLRNYDREPRVQAELQRRARGYAKVNRVPDILDTLYQQATDEGSSRSVQAAKVFLEYVEKMHTEGDGRALEEYTDEELFDRLNAMMEAVKDGR